MAEHLRNQMARAGIAVRPSQVMTLAQFLESKTSAGKAAPRAFVHLLIREALEKLALPRFGAVADYRGFHEAIAGLVDESPAGALPQDVAAILEFVERGLSDRGFASRRVRLNAARETKTPGQIVFDGFFSFSHGERGLIESFAERASVLVTVPEADAGLMRAGFEEHRLDGCHRRARASCFSAPSLEREVEEIARRILDQAAHGCAFREMGVIVRVREPYAPALETTFARFEIPARFYFADTVDRAPAVAYLSRVVRAMISGWDHAEVLAALRMPVSGIGATAEGDRFDFEVRERLPARGLPLPALAAFLTRFDSWRRDRVRPDEWASRLKELRGIVPAAATAKLETFNRWDVGIWRPIAASLSAWEAALEQTSGFDEAMEVTLAEFWGRAELALLLEPLRVPDRRQNVVHVMDVYEARQWELPVVFVCGMVERHFPQYHREDSLIGDAARRRAGLRTSSDLEGEERFLFELATTRATEETVLSYARFDEKGEETLRSSFLKEMDAGMVEDRVRPAPSRTVARAPQPVIGDEALALKLGEAHCVLSPTAIESFLQCPFQFFAERTLRLRIRPAAPRDRLDFLLQGSILHRALAEASGMPLLAGAVFEEVFRDECQRARVVEGYRTEAVRLELARHFDAFLNDRQVTPGWTSRVEEKFQTALSPALAIRGRIDRIDVGPQGQALVIDYKYSAGHKIRERVEECDAGNLVQGGLYLLAAEKAFDLKPAGMLYCGLKKEVVWDGWHAAIAGLEGIGETSTRARLDELMKDAASKAMETFEAIAGGVIAPRPADPDKCRWCDYRDVCRIESAAVERGAGAL
jgi:ATP-dependent helicase/DNAse subunit B